jgi:hypothetical protein
MRVAAPPPREIRRVRVPIAAVRRSAALAVALFAGVGLSACVSDGEVGARDDAVCTGQGYQTGSADYTRCRTMLSNQHRDDALVARSEYFSDI